MNVCVVGTGYVGLVAGACLADFGSSVICVDKDERKIEMLRNGRMPIYEMGLSDLVVRNAKLNRLSFTTSLAEAVDRSLVVFLAVGTPEGADGRADLSQIKAVALELAACMTEYKVIVIKSTVPVGTAALLRELIGKNLKNKVEFDIVSNPEFLREGVAVNDFLRPDRIIIGANSERAMAIMRDIYRPLYLLNKPIVATTNETAEVTKYAANTMLALRISFINEIANLCEKVGADVYDVAVAMGMDKRIGPKFLHAGPGYGGSCFPKDVISLVRISTDAGYQFRIAEAILEVNRRQRELVVEKSRKVLGSFEGKTITLLGLAFKPNTDDIREAPALYIAEAVMKERAKVRAYDPAAMEETKKVLSQIEYCGDPYAACDGSDLVMIVTEWNEFRDLNFAEVKNRARSLNLYDTRNIYNRKQVEELGFRYICTGRGKFE